MNARYIFDAPREDDDSTVGEEQEYFEVDGYETQQRNDSNNSSLHLQKRKLDNELEEIEHNNDEGAV